MTLLKQVGIILAGLAAAALMISLGGWQLGVYLAQGQASAQERADAPPVKLASVAPPGQQVGDAYGRTVTFTGRYDPTMQELIPVDGESNRFRVLTAFRLDGGGAVAVVRGVAAGQQAPEPPSGELTESGIFLPSESDPGPDDPTATPTTVDLPLLAQHWEPQLVNGFVTLGEDAAGAHGLDPAPLELPKGEGRLRNAFYALQWWVFAAFAVGMSIRMARDFGREAALAELGDAGTETHDGTAETPDSAVASSSSGSDPVRD